MRFFLFFFLLAVLCRPGYPQTNGNRIQIQVIPAHALLTVNGETHTNRLIESTGSSPVLIRASAPGYRTEQRALRPDGDINLTLKLMPEGSRHTFLSRVSCGIHPKEVIASPDSRYLIFTLLGDNGIDIYDLQEHRVTRRVIPSERALETGFVEGVFTADGREFWFTQMTTGWVYVLSVPDFTVKKIIKGVGNWTKVIEFTPDGKYAYVSNWLGNDITVIDTASCTIIRRFRVAGQAPRGLAFTADGTYLYIVCNDSGDILKYDTRTDRLVNRIVTGGNLDRIRLDPERRFAYIDNMYKRELYELDLTSDRITRTIPLWANPNNVRLSADAKTIYVACRGPNNPNGYLLRSPENGRIYVIDRATFKVIEVFEGGNQCVGLALTPDGRTLAFSNLQDNTIEIYTIER